MCSCIKNDYQQIYRLFLKKILISALKIQYRSATNKQQTGFAYNAQRGFF